MKSPQSDLHLSKNIHRPGRIPGHFPVQAWTIPGTAPRKVGHDNDRAGSSVSHLKEAPMLHLNLLGRAEHLSGETPRDAPFDCTYIQDTPDDDDSPVFHRRWANGMKDHQGSQ